MDCKTPPDDFIENSRARLTGLFQHRFEQREALRKERASERDIASLLLCNLAKEDKAIEKEFQEARERSLALAKSPLPKPLEKKFKFQDDSSTNISFGPPFSWPWKWNAQTGNGFFFTNADANSGNMSFSVYGDGGTASCAVAIGSFFQPTVAVGFMNVSAIPSITYSYGNRAWLSHAHTHAFIGLYIGQYTPGGDFVQAVVDQRINLWDLDTDNDFTGSSSGFPLSAFLPVDGNHFYEIWVWAGGDSESNGLSYSNLNIAVPSISIHVY
jgi:hypothetical protein